MSAQKQYVVSAMNGRQYVTTLATAVTYHQVKKQLLKRSADLELLRGKSDAWEELIGERDGDTAADLAEYAFSCAIAQLEQLTDEDLETLDLLLIDAPYHKGGDNLAQKTTALIESGNFQER